MSTKPIELSGGDYGGQTIDWEVDTTGAPILTQVGEIVGPDGKSTPLMGKPITDAAGTWCYGFPHTKDRRAHLIKFDPAST